MEFGAAVILLQAPRHSTFQGEKGFHYTLQTAQGFIILALLAQSPMRRLSLVSVLDVSAALMWGSSKQQSGGKATDGFRARLRILFTV